MYDLKITGGTIIDGSGAAGYQGDVGIRDGQIVALGDAPEDAKQTIDATGQTVCPGFVDVHTHYDAQVLWDRMLTISPWHGVTTVVMGNCGFGVAPTRPQDREKILRTLQVVEGMSYEALLAGVGPDWPFETFPEFLDAIEARGTAINVGVLLGHTPLRLYVMGEDAVERTATDDEVARMKDIVAEAMQAGAIGFATSQSSVHHGYGGKPVPSRLANDNEIAALAEPVGAAGGTLQITYGVEDTDLDKMAGFARDTGARVTWTALLAGLFGPAGHRPYLAKTAELKKQGLQVVPQVTNRAISMEFEWESALQFMPLSSVSRLETLPRDEKKAAMLDPAWRKEFTSQLLPYMANWEGRTVIVSAPGHPELTEVPVTEAAAKAGKHPTDFIFDLAVETDLKTKFRQGLLNHDVDDVTELLQDNNTVMGLSDAGAHNSQLCDSCQATDLLGIWVRERKVLSLEAAIHRLTKQAADVFGVKDRGLLAVGRPADVVVLDPDTVGAGPLQRVHDFPAGADRLISEATGINAVVVNGTLLRKDGKDQVDPKGTLPGKLLRGGQASMAKAAE